MASTKISGTGSSAPEKVMTNFDFEKIVETSDEWIRTRTGIAQRHIAEEDVATSDMAYEASKKAVEAAGIDPMDLGGIILATVTPDHFFPATACLIQSRLGAKNAFGYDLSAGCSGFVYGVQMGQGLIETGAAEHILVIGAETMSRIMDFEDRATCVLFGDGAGAAVLSRSEIPGIMSLYLGANGDDWELLHMPGGGSRMPPTEESLRQRQHYIKMKGNDVFKEAVKTMESSSIKVLMKAGLKPDDIDLFIPHQANRRIMEAVRKRLGIPTEKVFVNVDRYGNTSSASVPIALDEAVRGGRVNDGDLVLFSVFGAGFTWAAGLVRF
ncbi:MAG: ketoacyl-ACP synthase III [Candidatus Dadabacteria bacterium]|nr:ketoacyl-ACP synthase III [Candidatus Dadabacteria bacterium]